MLFKEPFGISLNADRAPQLKASVGLLLVYSKLNSITDTKRLATLIVVAFVSSCGGTASQQPTGETSASPPPTEEAKPAAALGLVSLIEVIGNPAKFSGKKIQVLGFMRLESEGNAIYFSRDDAKYHIIKNALGLEVPPTDSLGCKQVNDSFVVIEGTYYVSSKSHESLFSGSIENITMCRRWTKP